MEYQVGYNKVADSAYKRRSDFELILALVVVPWVPEHKRKKKKKEKATHFLPSFSIF